jgi:hypothetical protein
MLFSFIGTLGLYLASMFTLQSILNVTYIFTWEAMSSILIIVVLCWLPFFIVNKVYKSYFPEAHERV